MLPAGLYRISVFIVKVCILPQVQYTHTHDNTEKDERHPFSLEREMTLPTRGGIRNDWNIRSLTKLTGTIRRCSRVTSDIRDSFGTPGYQKCTKAVSNRNLLGFPGKKKKSLRVAGNPRNPLGFKGTVVSGSRVAYANPVKFVLVNRRRMDRVISLVVTQTFNSSVTRERIPTVPSASNSR